VYKINDRIVMVTRHAQTNDPPNGSRGTIIAMGSHPDHGGFYYTIKWDEDTAYPTDNAEGMDDPLEGVVYHDQITPEPVCFAASPSIVMLDSSPIEPPHYGDLADAYASINVIEAWGLGFHLGNVVKYVKRAGHKPGNPAVQDLRKAAWYLERAIANLESVAE